MRGLDRSLFLSLVMVALCVLTSCGQKSSHKAAKPPEVTVVQPKSQEVTKYLEYTGNTAALESVDIRARVMGFLQKICFEPRAKVKGRTTPVCHRPASVRGRGQGSQGQTGSAESFNRNSRRRNCRSHNNWRARKPSAH